MASVIAPSATSTLPSSYGASVNALRPSASNHDAPFVMHNPAMGNGRSSAYGAANGVPSNAAGSSGGASIRHSASNSNSLLAASIVNRPSLIEYKHLRS